MPGASDGAVEPTGAGDVPGLTPVDSREAWFRLTAHVLDPLASPRTARTHPIDLAGLHGYCATRARRSRDTADDEPAQRWRACADVVAAVRAGQVVSARKPILVG